MKIITLSEYVQKLREDDLLRKFIDPRFRVGIRPRCNPPNKVVLHWTAGEGSGPQVFRILQNHRLSVHYVIDREGTVWSAHNPHDWVAYHASVANDSSVGVEIVSSGTTWSGNKFNRKVLSDVIHGKKLVYLDFFPTQKEALRELLASILGEFPTIKRRVPVQENGKIISRQMAPTELRTFSGVCGHLHVTNKKIDPGIEIFRDVDRWMKE